MSQAQIPRLSHAFIIWLAVVPTVSMSQVVRQTTLAAPVAKDFEQFVPYWTTEGSWHSELQLRNNLRAEDLTVTPSAPPTAPKSRFRQ